MAEPTPDLDPLPCPFCGGENIALGMNRDNVWCVCVRCDATGPIAQHGPNDDPANAMRPAIDVWNRRSPLIAAAPDLLAACECVDAIGVGKIDEMFAVFRRHGWRGDDVDGASQWVQGFLRAALAKARPPEA